MKIQFKIEATLVLRDGTVALTGTVVDGRLLETRSNIGKRGVALSPPKEVEVEVLGIGVVDPNLVTPNRQGILVKLVRGDAPSLNGLTLTFE